MTKPEAKGRPDRAPDWERAVEVDRLHLCPLILGYLFWESELQFLPHFKDGLLAFLDQFPLL